MEMTVELKDKLIAHLDKREEAYLNNELREGNNIFCYEDIEEAFLAGVEEGQKLNEKKG